MSETTWSDLRDDVRAIISDDVEPYTVQDDTLLRYANYGLQWVATRHPRSLRATAPVVDGLATLPDGWRKLDAVYAAQTPVEQRDLSLDGPFPAPGECVVVSDDEIRFGAATGEAEIYFQTGYPAIALDDDAIPLPRHLEEALLYYVASRGLSQRAANSANLDQFDRKVDSGKPTDNPLLQMAGHYKQQAESVLASYAQR